MPRIALLIPMMVVLLLAGCGGSSGTKTSAATSPAGSGTSGATNDRASFISKADAVCKTYNARQEALRARSKGVAVTKLPPILREQASIAGSLSRDLGKLSPPAADRATVARFVASVHLLSVYSLAVANSIAAKHAFAARTLANKLTLARQQEALLGQGYGYHVCASGRSY